MPKEQDNDICAKCGRYRREHCEFELAFIPNGCKCNPNDWFNMRNIPSVCDKFEPMEDDKTLCMHCQHLKECHKK
jgi:hypothetical protein